ncbi:MAG: hypothetical protein DRN06_04770 [Thermoprotei archaeon]|nr:MAG: hypothetical protein DRN06_04770 [Thermoprotei archaeon]
MRVRTLVLTLETAKPIREDGSKLRGFIANKFKEYPLLHHHVDGRSYIYTYPKVQYKVIGGTAIILGIAEGADVLRRVADEITHLKLGRSEYVVERLQMIRMDADFGVCRAPRRYKFLTPWLALNQKNYERFRRADSWKERKSLLNAILIGNILSMCKGLNFVVTRRLRARSLLQMETVSYKNMPRVGFKGEFEVNFIIPDLFGIGKAASQGFGVVMASNSDFTRSKRFQKL